MHSPVIIRATLVVSGAIGVLFGLFFLLAAGQAIASFELGSPTIPALLFARSAGAAILSLSLVNILAAFHPLSRTTRAIAIGNVVVHVLSIAVDFSENYPRNAGVWVGLAIHVILIAAFGYCLVHWREMTSTRA
jgi:hypothetical protein